jgi:hypothetical protein
MTYQTTSEQFFARIPARGQTNSTAPFLTARGALAQLGKLFTAIGHGLVRATESSSRLHRVEALQAKSDAELAQMGLKRDDIVHHVFKDLFYV